MIIRFKVTLSLGNAFAPLGILFALNKYATMLA
jgi:hypothetical protein